MLFYKETTFCQIEFSYSFVIPVHADAVENSILMIAAVQNATFEETHSLEIFQTKNVIPILLKGNSQHYRA